MGTYVYLWVKYLKNVLKYKYLSTGTLKMRDMKMQDRKMRHKAAEGGKCRNGKSGKRKV